MAAQDLQDTQIYLITPPAIDLATFPDRLARVLDAHPVACLRMALATRDEETILRAGDVLREIAHARDIPLVIEDHVMMVARLGLDGVHLSDGSRPLRKLRGEMGNDAIIGAFCGVSRHDGMNAGEAGADYIAFGPAGSTALGTGERAEHELFDWWSAMIELPVVAEGALTPELVAELAPVVDFLALGEEIWSAEDPVARFKALVAPLG